jgi:ATP-dependent Clp protease ATP-binding subunit ClpC
VIAPGGEGDEGRDEKSGNQRTTETNDAPPDAADSAAAKTSPSGATETDTSFVPGVLRTLVVLRQLSNGTVLGFPAADPTKTSMGSEDEVLGELVLYLQDVFVRAPPQAVARHAFPEGTTLQVTAAVLPRDDLPSRAGPSVEIDLPYLAIPAKEGTWVSLLPFAHTLHVERGGDVALAVREEAVRLVVGQSLNSYEYLTKLPAEGHRLVELAVPLPDQRVLGALGDLRKKVARQERRKRAVAVLDAVATPVHALHDGGRHRTKRKLLRPLIGRDAEVRMLGTLLGDRAGRSVLLVGRELVGKSAVLQAFVRREDKEDRPLAVYATSAAQLLAGMSGLGQWQERVRRVMEAAETLEAILYFDNLADLFAENAGGGVDIPSVMKPYLEEGRVRVVAEARPELFDRVEARNVGFFSAFGRLRIEPMTAAEAQAVVTAVAAHDHRHTPERPSLAAAAVPTLIGLAERYLSYLAFPGKATRLYDELRALHDRDRDETGAGRILAKAEVTAAFSRQTGVPAFLLEEQAGLVVEEVVKTLSRSVVGQEQAVRRVAALVAVIKARLATADKPLATLLFVGPTGVGKTELARALAAYLFGREDRIVRFDMSEYMDGDAADRLLRGSGDREGALTRRVREHPFCVLLLDEIEKAHPSVFDLLLQVAGEGRLSDARGRTAYFHNTILILTSNLGAASRKAPVGFDRPPADDTTYYEGVVDKSFRPEFVNRLDRVVAFRSLGKDEVAAITRGTLARLVRRRGFVEAGIRLVLDETPNAAGETPESHLAAIGYSPTMGARALRRAIEDALVSPVAAVLAGLGADGRDLEVRVSLAGGEPPRDAAVALATRTTGNLTFRAFRVQKRGKQARAGRAMAEISSLRREGERLLELPSAEDLRDNVAYVTAELADARGTNATGQAHALRLAEHDRERRIVEGIEDLNERLRTLEDVAMEALHEGESLDEYVVEATQLARELATKTPAVLLARQADTSGASLCLDELDDGRALDRYVPPLLSAARARGWRVRAFVPTFAAREATTVEGPWALVADVASLVLAPQRSFRSVLLEVAGPLALLLALESGRVSFTGLPGPYEETDLLVTFLRAGPLEKEQFSVPAAIPLTPVARTTARKQRVDRVLDVARGTVQIGAREAVELPVDAHFDRLEELAAPTLLAYETDPALDRWDLFDGALA